MRKRLIRLMIVDDHAMLREGLKHLLELQGDMEVIAEAKDGEEAIQMVQKCMPDVVIMDINMPKINGLEALKAMKDMGIKSKIIILSAYANKEYIIEAIKIGAKGFLLKDSKSSALVKAIRDVSSGRNYMQPGIVSILNQYVSGEIKENNKDYEKINILSRREYEVLVLIASGYNNREIGEKLFISEKTVKNHITNIFRKLEVEDRVQATIFAFNNHIKEVN